MNIAIEQIQHGNEQAFKSLFDEYYQGLCVFASAYLKDDDLSADVVQEAFVKFWNRRRDFDHIVKIKSFLYTIVRNDCLNIVQRQKVVLEDVSVFENSGFFHANFETLNQSAVGIMIFSPYYDKLWTSNKEKQ